METNHPVPQTPAQITEQAPLPEAKWFHRTSRWLIFGAGVYMTGLSLYNLTTGNASALETAQLIFASIGSFVYASTGKHHENKQQ